MARGEVIRIRNEFYIRSSSARVDVRTRVLKQGDMFAVFDRFVDVETFGTGELGLFYQDKRFLSRLTLNVLAKCGFSPLACHTRWTIELSMPSVSANVRTLQCVA